MNEPSPSQCNIVCPTCGAAAVDRDVVGIKAIGAVLALSTRTVRRLMRRDRDPIPFARYGGQVVAALSELAAWKRRNRRGGYAIAAGIGPVRRRRPVATPGHS